MRTSREKSLYLIIFLILTLIVQSTVKIKAVSYGVTTKQQFKTYLAQGASINFQWGDKFVKLLSYTGNLNSSNCILHFGSEGGRYTFTANETFQLQISHNVSTVKVNGLGVQSDDIVSLSQNDNVIVEWNILIAPLWPIVFALGMVGLFAMFAGPYYAVSNFKKKNYREGARTGLIVTVIGIALFIAWLW